MIRHYKWLAAVVMFVVFSITGTAGAKPAETQLKVFLQNVAGLSVVLNGDYSFYNADNKKLLGEAKNKDRIDLALQGGLVCVKNRSVKAANLEIRPKNGKAVIILGKKEYHGGLLLKKSAGKIQVINIVGLEDYLKGVVPSEMSESWPAEALKAQAVAARTFALYTKGEEKHDGYDLCASTHCQVYEGISCEAASANSAVAATRGEVLCYKGEVIYAAFHADSGGFTAGSEEVWGGKQPYLRPVKDNTAGSPCHDWEEAYTVGEVEEILRDNGYYIGNLKKILLTPLVAGQGSTADRYQSGRVQQVRFIGNKGEASVTGNTARSIFDLYSTLFDIHFSSEKKWKREHNLKNNSKEKVVFVGHGWGHGLGMSQWGAKFMSNKNDYRKILRHFYTNVEIKKLY